MSINQDPDFNKILIGIIAFLFGILNVIGLRLLSDLKDSDKEIYKKLDDHEHRLSTLQGEHKARHG